MVSVVPCSTRSCIHCRCHGCIVHVQASGALRCPCCRCRAGSLCTGRMIVETPFTTPTRGSTSSCAKQLKTCTSLPTWSTIDRAHLRRCALLVMWKVTWGRMGGEWCCCRRNAARMCTRSPSSLQPLEVPQVLLARPGACIAAGVSLGHAPPAEAPRERVLPHASPGTVARA